MTINRDAWRRAIDGEDPPPYGPKAQVIEFPVPEALLRQSMRVWIRAAIRSGRAGAYLLAARKIQALPLPEAKRIATGMATVARGIKLAKAAR